MPKRIIAAAVSSALVIGCSTVPIEKFQGELENNWCNKNESETESFSPCMAYLNANSLRNALIQELNDVSSYRTVADFILLSAAVVGLAGVTFDRHIDWIKGSALAAIGVTGYREYLVPEVKIDNLHKAIKRLSCVISTRPSVLGAEESAVEFLKKRGEFNTIFDNINRLSSELKSANVPLGTQLQAEVDKILNDRKEDLSYVLRFEQRVRSASYKILDTTESIYISLLSDNITSKPDVGQIIADMKEEAKNQTLDDKDGERAEARQIINKQVRELRESSGNSLSELVTEVNKYNRILKSIALLGDTYTQLDEDLLACKIMP